MELITLGSNSRKFEELSANEFAAVFFISDLNYSEGTTKSIFEAKCDVGALLA